VPERPEVVNQVSTVGLDVVEKPLGAWNTIYANGAVRKTALLILLAAAWEGYARWLGNSLLFPTFFSTVAALFSAIGSGELPRAAGFTIKLLLKGYVAGVVLAALLFGALSHGALVINTMVPKELVDILQAVVILAVVITGNVFQDFLAARMKAKVARA